MSMSPKDEMESWIYKTQTEIQTNTRTHKYTNQFHTYDIAVTLNAYTRASACKHTYVHTCICPPKHHTHVVPVAVVRAGGAHGAHDVCIHADLVQLLSHVRLVTLWRMAKCESEAVQTCKGPPKRADVSDALESHVGGGMRAGLAVG